jgi:hypothetical protein
VEPREGLQLGPGGEAVDEETARLARVSFSLEFLFHIVLINF